MIKTSVIIPTRSSTGPLHACLAALAGSFPADAETIVIVDGGPVDFGPLADRFADRLRLRWRRIPRSGPAAARNRGLAMARGDIVAFTDDDCRPAPGWVAAIGAGVSAVPPVAVGGSTINGLAANPYADAAQVVLDLLACHERATLGSARFFPGNNCAFPAAPLRALGGFDEAYRTAEDRDLCRRWVAAGHRLSYAPGAVVEHDADTDLHGFLRKFFAYGRGAARFHRESPGPTWLPTLAFHARLPWLMAPEVARRGPGRGSRLAALLALWECANLAGFVTELVGSWGNPGRDAPQSEAES